MVIFSNLYQVPYPAFAAPLAIMNIICKSDVALVDLQAVRQEKKYFLRPQLFFFYKPVIEVYDKPLIILFFVFKKRSGKHKERI